MQPAAQRAMEAAAAMRCVYLRCDPEVLDERICADADSRATRPHLTALEGGLEEIRAMLRERGPVYEQLAGTVVDVTRLPAAEAAAEVVRLTAPPPASSPR